MTKELILEAISTYKERGCTLEELQASIPALQQDDVDQYIKSYDLALTKKGRYILAAYRNIFIGTMRLNKKGFGFVEVADSSDLYVSATDMNQAMDKDRVAIMRKETADATSAVVLAILEHGTTFLTGTARKSKDGWILECDNLKIMQHVIILNVADKKLVDGHKVRLQLTGYAATHLEGNVDLILGHESEPGIDILSILTEFNVQPAFGDAVMREVNAIAEDVQPEQKSGRVDLTGEWICTIDGDDSKDLDDAIHVRRSGKGYTLGVHIADVSHYVCANSALDKEAYTRGTSVYVVDRVVPMLPQQLSNGICSLHADVERLTLSCVMQFDSQGVMQDYQLFPSVIKSQARMTYNNVNLLLEGDAAICKRYAEHVDDFHVMLELSHKIRSLRSRRGAIDFDTSESKFILDKQGKVLDIVRRERYEAERIIEDFMIAANECVAQHMRFLDLPFLYRVHEQPEAKRLREFAKVSLLLGYPYRGSATAAHVLDMQRILIQAKDSEVYPILNTYLLRCMSKARYDVSCIGHFGLGSENYTHFTSPIRRYPDLIVHRMLRKYVFNQVHDEQVINDDQIHNLDIALQSSNRERAAVDAERAVEAMKKAEFFEDKIKMQYNGVISSVTNFGLFVELDNTVEGLVHIQKMHDDYYFFDAAKQALIGERTKKRYQLGQQVHIRVTAASKKTSTIDFELVEPKKKKERNPRKRWM